MCRIRNSRALLRENSRLLVSTEEHAAGCALLSQHSNTTAAGGRRTPPRWPGGGGGGGSGGGGGRVGLGESEALRSAHRKNTRKTRCFPLQPQKRCSIYSERERIEL